MILPARTISGSLEVPGDKSISHRYAMLASLAEGPSDITHFSAAADCRSTLDCFSRLGVKIDIRAIACASPAPGSDGLRKSRRALDAGNSGTTMRLLSGIMAGQEFRSTLDGDASLRKRPMRRIMDPLTQMGARIEAREGGFAPLKIDGTRLSPHRLQAPGCQRAGEVRSAVRGIVRGWDYEPSRSRCARGTTRSWQWRNSARASIMMGARSASTGGPKLKGRTLAVPGDLSSAVFFLAAAMVLPESNLVIHNVGLNPTRSAVLDVLGSMGAPDQPGIRSAASTANWSAMSRCATNR